MKVMNRTLLLAALATIGLSGQANGDTIASANFTGVSATNVITLAASGTAGLNDFAWSRVNSLGNMSIVDANLITGSGNALQYNTNNTFEGVLGTMSSSTAIAIGETLTLSFIGQYTAAPANNGGGLRFGFVNSEDPDNAFGFQIGTGTETNLAIMRDTGGDNSPIAGTQSTLISGSGTQNIGTSVYTALFSITRTADDTYSYFGDINGSTLSATNIVGGFDNYNAIAIRNGFNPADFQIDNVSVTLVPEPSSLALLGLGGLLIGSRRRRD